MVSELHKNIELYLNGRCTVQSLETWVLSHLQRILDTGDNKAIDVANRIDADLVQFGEGLIDESRFREHVQRLDALLETTVGSFQETLSEVLASSGSSAETIRGQVAVLGQVREYRFDHRFA